MDKKGFSLIEMSVVLVIIGLLVGVLIAARSLRSAAKIQATITDLGKYKQAALQYKEKYYYWPGDDLNAANVWNGVNNGNGDGQINGGANCASPCSTNEGDPTFGTSGSENEVAFQALSQAGFITGSYTAVGNPAPGVNFPASPIDIISGTNLNKAIYILVYENTSIIGSPNKNVVSVADYDSTHNVRAGIIAPLDAYAIDQKIDDGIINTGNIRSFGLGYWTGNSTSLPPPCAYVANLPYYKCIVDFFME